MRLELWDMLSILVLLVTLCIGVYFVLIFMNPFSELNPLKPIDPKAPPTSTITPIGLAPTWTASPTIEPTITETPRPTFTPLASPTFFSLVPPTKTPVPTNTPKAPFSASITSIASTIIHPEVGLQLAGSGRHGGGHQEQRCVGIVVRLLGTLNGKRVEMTTGQRRGAFLWKIRLRILPRNGAAGLQ